MNEQPSGRGQGGPGIAATRFVGRQAELDALAVAATEVAAGDARIVFVEGAAGSGKTELVRHATATLLGEFRVLRAEADELGPDAEMHVAAQLGVDTSATPFAGGLALLEHIGELQADGPVAVILEDLHWVDTASQHTILAALRRLDQDHVLVLVTSRPPGSDGHVEDPGWERLRADPHRSRRIAVGALSVQDVAALAAAVGRPLTTGAAERLHRHTAGHALHTATLLAELSDEQLRGAEDELPAPRSLAALTLARLAGGSGDALAMVSLLAVLNRRTSLAELGRLSGIADPTAALDELLATGVVTWEPSEPLTPVSFTHPLHRAAVYEDLSPVRRRELHDAAARSADRATSLQHRVAASDSTDEVLAVELEQFASDRVSSGDLALASRALRWAATVGDPELASQRVLEAVRLLLRGSADQAIVWRREVESCPDSWLRSRVLGEILWRSGAAARAEALLLDAASEESAAADPELAAEAVQHLSSMYGVLSRGREAKEHAARTTELAPDRHDLQRLATITTAIGAAAEHGAVRALELVETFGTEGKDPELAATTGMLHLFAGQRRAAARDLTLTIEAARSGRVAIQLPRAHVYLSQVQFGLGDWDAALMNARVALSLIAQGDSAWHDTQAHAAASAVCSARGEHDAAREHLDACRASTAASIEADFVVRIAEAGAATALGRPQDVIEPLEPLVPGGDPAVVPMMSSLTWWPTLISAYLALGELDLAATHLDGFDRATEVRALDLSVSRHRLRGELALAHGDTSRAVAELALATAALDEDDALLERAATHLSHGIAQRDAGDRRAATAQLRQARELLAGVGARPYLARVDEALATVGVRVESADTAVSGRSSPTTASPLALSEREQDVAALVAKGLTNKEVAAELYVSVKAVEFHLRNIFDKLGISSRRQLRTWSRPGG